MKAMLTTREAPARPSPMVLVPRRLNLVVRRVDPWSVLKFSLLFYFALMLIFLLAAVILYWVLGIMGILDVVTDWLRKGWGPQRGPNAFTINGTWLFSRLFFAGLIGVVAWSVVNMLLAVLYNLCSDLVGGVEITADEKR